MRSDDTDPVAASGPFSFLTRRRALQLALGAGGVLLTTAGGLALLRGSAPAVAGLRVLSAHEYRTLSALARVHLPTGGAFEQGAEGLDLPRAFDRYLADEHPENIRDLRRAVTLLEFGPVLFEGQAQTFSNLPAAAQEAHFHAWTDSDLLLRRQVAFAFRKFLSFVFYDTPQVWKHIGYSGPSLRGMP